MKAPFVWFGGKRRVASLVWDALGDVDNHVEPFGGSLAMLLERPAWHYPKAETVNDADAFIANFWRALQAAPDEVAYWADWPVNETDLFARHLWLVNSGAERLAALEADPDFFDAKVAGWWVWGINAWIGSGWCSGTGPWVLADDARQLGGMGMNRQLPHLGDAGRGVNGPDDEGAFTAGGSGAPANQWERTRWCADGEPAVYGYMRALAHRLRRVRVCGGDWTRVVTDGALNYGATVGMFLDPPYLGDVRTADLYRVDDHLISTAVREWCLAHEGDPRLRIILAGYRDEHDEHMPAAWRRHFYSASLAYGPARGANGEPSGNGLNRHKEVLWFSPSCERSQPTLFEASGWPA